MPSVRYYNQTAPFWDFVANMEEQGASHPFFAGYNNRGETSDNENEHPTGPSEPGWSPFGAFGPFAHRGRHGPHHRHYPPPPPPPPPQPANGPSGPDEKDNDPEEGPSGPRGPPPPFSERPEHGEGPRHRGPGGRCGGRGKAGWGGRGRYGPHGFAGPMGGFAGLANMFQAHLFGDESGAAKDKSEDFKPDVDVFDASEAFVIHVSLPGAKKEDVGVNWDAEKSELNIAGVIYRPGDEELLKTLALDERKIGAFERKVRLGSRANPAQVDTDAITAKMEDGVLRVEVPKLDSGYVEIKKVDIE